MSRGPGKLQRAILEAVDEDDRGVLLVGPWCSPARSRAIRRAARRLEVEGLVRVELEVEQGRRRAVVYP